MSAPSSPERIEAVAKALRAANPFAGVTDDEWAWMVQANGYAEIAAAALDAYDREHQRLCDTGDHAATVAGSRSALSSSDRIWAVAAALSRCSCAPFPADDGPDIDCPTHGDPRGQAAAAVAALDAYDREHPTPEVERLGAMVEWLCEVIVDAREACQRAERIEPKGSAEWVESGIAMRTTALREVRSILDRERNADPSRFDRMRDERDEARAEVERLREYAGHQEDDVTGRCVCGAEWICQQWSFQLGEVAAREARYHEARAAIGRVETLLNEWGGRVTNDDTWPMYEELRGALRGTP